MPVSISSRGVLLALSLLSAGSALSADFVLRDIRVSGLQRIDEGTVFNYFPFKVGDLFTEGDSAPAIRALYETGLFEDVRLDREGEVLLIVVRERPAIGRIEFSGNKRLKTEDLVEALQQVGFAEGRIFDKSQLDRIEQELRRQYFSFGRYGVSVRSVTEAMEENRVAVHLEIDEGSVARIRRIRIVGYSDFEEEELLDEFKSSEGGWFSFFSTANQYSREKLSGDLQALRSFYLDRGYLRFQIDSTQVSISPDRRNIYITVNIEEGGRYNISDLLLSGDLVGTGEQLLPLVRLRRGELFSRKKVLAAADRINERLGEDGYAFANVNPVPDIDDVTHTAAVTFYVDPGKRVYVRRILFSGNISTRDEVLRRQMRQQEGAWFSSTQVERGRVRLQRLGYFQGVGVETQAVSGVDDQVDVNYSVTESPSGNLLAGLGFSQSQGLILKLSITQDNFIGSGNRMQFEFNNSDVDRRFSLSYLNPFYTIDGVSRGIDVYYRKTDASEANITSFTSKVLGGGFSFGIPFSEYNQFNVSLHLDRTFLTTTSSTSTDVQEFLDSVGDEFNILRFSSSLSYDTRNRAFLPNKGVLLSLRGEAGLPNFRNALHFFKLELRGVTYFPLVDEYVLKVRGQLGYGRGYSSTKQLPFFENFYLGGPRSVRGYEDNTLGPRDSSDAPRGGNLKLLGSTELILPLPFLENTEQLRLALFLDSGNVYDLEQESLSLGDLRYAGGISGIWLSPLGVLSLSFSVPFGSQPEDRTQRFQFTYGTAF